MKALHTLLALLLILLTALLVFLIKPGGSNPPKPPPLPALSPKSSSSKSLTSGSKAPPIQEAQRISREDHWSPRRDPAYQASLSKVRSRILWEGSRLPVPGVDVRAIPLSTLSLVPDLLGRFRDLSLFLQSVPKTRTDSGGRFVLPGLDPGLAYLALIGSSKIRPRFRILNPMLSPGKEARFPDILLTPSGRLQGKVSTQDGKPISNALVIATDLPRSFLEEGICDFDPEGFVLLKKTDFVEKDLQIVPLPSYRGPLLETLPIGITRTNKEGAFFFRGLPKGRCNVVVATSDFLPAIKTTTIHEGKVQELSDIQVWEGLQIQGKVLDEDGSPLEGARISYARKTEPPFYFGKKPMFTPKDGRFRFRGLGPGAFYLLVQYSPKTPWTISGPHQPKDSFVLRKPKSLSRRFRFLPPKGQALPRLSFELRERRTGPSRNIFSPSYPTERLITPSSKKGEWTLHSLPKGNYFLQVHGKGIAPLEYSIELKENAPPLKLQLLPAISAQIQVKTPKGAPLSSAHVFFCIPPVYFRFLGWSNKAGRLTVPDFPQFPSSSAKQVLVARHPSFAMGMAPIEEGQGLTKPMVIRMVSPGKILGQVLGNKPFPSKTLSLALFPGVGSDHPLRPFLQFRLIETDAKGRFRFEGVQPGSPTVLSLPSLSGFSSFDALFNPFFERLFAFVQMKSVHVREGQEARVTFHIKKQAQPKGKRRIEGEVRSHRKGKLTALLRYQNLFFVAPKSITVTPEGRFHFSGLPAGDYLLQILDWQLPVGQQVLAEKRILLSSKDDFETIVIATKKISFLFLDPKGIPIPNTKIHFLKRPEALNFSTYTDDRGMIALELPEGNWALSLEQEQAQEMGFVLPNQTIQVGSSSPKTWKLRAQALVSIKGHLNLDFSLVHPDWLQEVQENPPGNMDLDGNGFSWSQRVPLVEKNKNLAFQALQIPAGTYSVEARSYCDIASPIWTGQIKVLPKAKQILQIHLTPPAEITLPRKKK